MEGLSCYRKLPVFYVFRAYWGNGHGLAEGYICHFQLDGYSWQPVQVKIYQKTADKQKDVRYNGGRTKSNAALSMRGDSLWVLPANTK